MNKIQLFLAMFAHKARFSIFFGSMFYFLLKTFSFIINDVFEKSNENICSETAKLTKRKSAEVFNI